MQKGGQWQVSASGLLRFYLQNLCMENVIADPGLSLWIQVNILTSVSIPALFTDWPELSDPGFYQQWISGIEEDY